MKSSLIYFELFYFQTGLAFGRDLDDHVETEPLEKISMEHLILPFVVLGAGTLVAGFVFLCEIGFFRMSMSQIQNSV